MRGTGQTPRLCRPAATGGREGGAAMRLDKLISACGVASRSETARACRAGLVTVNGQTARSADMQVDPETDAVSYGGRAVAYRRFVYLMLNKPAGYVSSTDAGDGPPVTDLLPEEYRRMGVFPCGRLDRDTLGLMLLTNNGPLSHRLLAPRSHVAKSYRFAVSGPLGRREAAMLEAGVDIGGYVTRPCRVELTGPDCGVITLTEGKYHQIKRMMERVGVRVTTLERLSFGPLTLDPALERGRWRPLTPGEEAALGALATPAERV